MTLLPFAQEAVHDYGIHFVTRCINEIHLSHLQLGYHDNALAAEDPKPPDYLPNDDDAWDEEVSIVVPGLTTFWHRVERT